MMQTNHTPEAKTASKAVVRRARIIKAERRIDAIQSRIPLRAVLIACAILLVVIVFFCARSEGIKQGQRDAREKIENENDLMAGPESLIQ